MEIRSESLSSPVTEDRLVDKQDSQDSVITAGKEGENDCDTMETNLTSETIEDLPASTESNMGEITNNNHQDEPTDQIHIKTELAETQNNENITNGVMNTKVTDPSSLSKAQRKRKKARIRQARARKLRALSVNAVLALSKAQADALELELKRDIAADMTEDVEYCLTVANLPNSWSFMEIKNYVDTEVGPVDEIRLIKDNKTGFGAIRLLYQSVEECMGAKMKLQGKVVDGNELGLEMSVASYDSDSDTKSDIMESSTPSWKPDMDSWEIDPTGMYGLKLPFLNSMGISPPLDRWVHVSNFRCDKSEIRDVMEMAGNVVMCSVFMVAKRYANVMYSHPLEAVQAVSMLNNQMLYGQQLKVVMDRSPNETVLMPKGLSTIGNGLGLNGKPIKSVVKHYERFLENKDCLLNPVMFDVPENHNMRKNKKFVTFEVKSVEEFSYPIQDVNVTKAATTTVNTATTPSIPIISPRASVQTPAYTVRSSIPPLVGANPPPQNYQRPYTPTYRPFAGAQNLMAGGMQGPRGPTPMPMQPAQYGPTGPMHMGPRPMGPGPMPPGTTPGSIGPRPMVPGPRPMGPGPRPMGPGPRPMAPGQGPMRPLFPNEPVKLLLANLPPSTTFTLLCQKMAEWGHVVSLQLTTPGCAVVTFGNRMQADACFQHFNGRSIDNYVIHVQYA